MSEEPQSLGTKCLALLCAPGTELGELAQSGFRSENTYRRSLSPGLGGAQVTPRLSIFKVHPPLNHGHDGRGVYPWGQTALVGCSSRLVTLGLTYADTNAFI